jgi:hypothetical protein
MMQHILCHSLKQQQPGLGMSAYWSLFANTNVKSDRTSEIRLGFQEGDGYA